MKYIYPKLLFICLAIAVYCNNKSDKQKTIGASHPKNEYRLVVKRGAFHYDRFDITKNKIRYTPDSSSSKEIDTYNSHSETYLDSLPTIGFFKKIEADGFWNLKDRYRSESTCASQLIITLTVNEKSKTVICDNFERDCPDLIKYIDRKVVELQGNDLKRIYPPG